MGWLLILIRSTKVLECFASEDRKGGSTDKYLLSADGKPLGKNEEVPSCRNWAWWDGDLLRETFKGDDNRWGQVPLQTVVH